MSDPTETSGRPLPPTANQLQQPQATSILLPTSTRTQHHSTSPSSNEPLEGSKTTFSRRRPGTKQASTSPHPGSSRSEQRSSTSPMNMVSQLPSVHYTRTGRISKAKKGLKVHNCENCGRSYTRAEHLRRHQKNHAQDDALVCDFPECGKTFYRVDLLHRHQERHNEPGKDSRQHSVFSQEGSPEAVQTSVPGLVPSSIAATTLPPTPSYYTPQPISPMHESAALPSHTKQRGAYATTRHHSVAIPVPMDAMTPSLSWSESYSHSPGYSSSSGYASPIPGPGDFANMFANPPYNPTVSRTRTPSNASFVEQWSYPSRSPTSTASTMAYTWPSSDKTPTAPGLAFIGASYPMTSIPLQSSIDPMTGYEHFGPKTMLQRDEEEGIVLFGEQPYGMGPIAHSYPFEQYLDNFWRLFHPTFPVVHRSTFESMTASPMLHAAMIAIGGQYSNDTSVKRKSRILHDRCMKLLERRDHDQHLMAEPDRLCDYQAIFLLEVLSQYRSRRAARNLSSRFAKVYRKSAADFSSINSRMNDINITPETATMGGWVNWIELATWQRLLVSCYILESQQVLFLAREASQSLIQESGLDLPFPSHSSCWDATSPVDWAFAIQQSSHYPRYVYEVTADLLIAPFDAFQSSMIIAAHYGRIDPQTYVQASSVLDVEHLLDASPATMRKLFTAKLVQVTPIRALLAVSGESWILSEKSSSAQAFTALKTTLRTWVAQLWNTNIADAAAPIKEALTISVSILEQGLKEQQDAITLEIGTDMGLFFASLVLWAITTAANTRVNGQQKTGQQQPLRHQSQSPLSFGSSTSLPPTPTHIINTFSQPSFTPTRTQSTGFIPTPPSPASQTPLNTNLLLSHAQITINTITFLSTALLDFGSADSLAQLPMSMARLQTGCTSLLLWTKLRLRGVPLDDQSGVADAWLNKPSEGLGELLEGVTGSLERVLNRGWSGWGI